MDLTELISTIEILFASYGYLIVFLASFIEISPLGWAIPGGLVLSVAGFFAYGEKLTLFSILLAGWMGSWLTFLLAYYLGDKTGLKLAKKLKQEKNAQKARYLLEKHGAVILTTSMLASLTRFWIAYVAGSQKYNKFRFLFYSGAASLTWSSLMIVVGYLAGAEREQLEYGLARLGIISWLLLFVALGVIYWKTRKEFDEYKKGELKKTSK
jgi:membrane protein DedA with SNARE-associated domain